MNFLIADTFQSSLARLSGQEQKAAKTAAFDLQLDPTGKGKSFHRLDRVRDPNFWSVRVDRDLRLIVHRARGSLLLAYVGRHDDAYAWAARRLRVPVVDTVARIINLSLLHDSLEGVHEIFFEKGCGGTSRLDSVGAGLRGHRDQWDLVRFRRGADRGNRNAKL